MKHTFSRKFSVFLLGMGLTVSLSFPAAAINTDTLDHSSGLRHEWPDLQEIASTQEGYDFPSTNAFFLQNLPLSGDALTDFLEKFPFSLEGGSFFINKMYGFPMQLPPEYFPEIQYKSGQLITRDSWKLLEQEIASRLEQYQGDWSVYIKNLENGKTIRVNEHSMESASLIKLYIAGATYELIEQGKIEETDTIITALNQMITVSDNESSNVLVRAMYQDGEDFQDGLDIVNDFITRHGFTNTVQVNGIADPSLWVSDGRVNMTSAADCGKLLEMIYNGELVSHFSSFRFEVLLNKQEINYKIPDGLPKGVHISHKTGEVDDTENDAAIIYTPYGDYIFCILSTDLTDTNAAVDHIHEITQLVYDYFVTDAEITEADSPASLSSLYQISNAVSADEPMLK